MSRKALETVAKAFASQGVRTFAAAAESKAPAVPNHVKIPDIFENFIHKWPPLPPKPTIPSGASWFEREKIMDKYWEEVIYHGPHMYRLDTLANPRLTFLTLGFFVYVLPFIAGGHALWNAHSKFLYS